MTLINAKSNNKAASLPPNEEMLVNLIFPVLSHFTVYFSLCVYYTITTLPLRNIPSANRLSSYWWPVAQVFLCPAHVNFQCLYQWVPIQWSSKYYEKSETLLFWVIHDLSVKLGATQPEWRSTCISFHAFMLLGSYAKDYTGTSVLSIIYIFVYSHCSFPSCAKKLIKLGLNDFIDILMLQSCDVDSFKTYKKILIIYLIGPAFRHICTGYTEVT